MAEERVQRRLAAILAADVVGYSRMMGEDEAGTLAQIKTLQREVFEPKTREHNGRIFNTSGDGVLVEFASVVDAVQHALDVQRALARRNADVPAERRIELRIGINLGDIIVDGDDIYGDGVNIAARLESLAQPGGIYISGTVYESVRNSVPADYEDLGEQSVKNINRPIRIIDVSLKSVADDPIGALTRSEETKSGEERRSISVLPFDNLGDDASDDHICDGMTEDIITALSHMDELSIVARTTTMAFKGRSMDIQEVGRQLGADFVVEGSVRRAGDRIRVTGQLIDVSTGHHVWADRYDRDLTNVFDLQDDITANVAAALQVKFVEGEQAQSWRRAAGDFESWRILLEARNHQRTVTKAGIATAIRLLSEAVGKNPGTALLSAHLAFTHCLNARHGWGSDPEASLRDAEELAKRAITLDDSLGVAYCYSGYVHLALLRHDEAIALGKRAMALDPNNGESAIILAFAVMCDGRAAEALPLFVNAYRLYAITPPVPQCYLADCYRLLGRLDEALETIQRVREQNPGLYVSHLYGALIEGQRGHPSQAEEAVRALLDIEPAYSLKRIPPLFNYRDRGSVDEVIDILRNVGVPE